MLKSRLQKGDKTDCCIPNIQRNRERDDEVNKKLLVPLWTVIRFWGKDVMKNVNECIKFIDEAVFDIIAFYDE